MREESQRQQEIRVWGGRWGSEHIAAEAVKSYSGGSLKFSRRAPKLD